MHKPEMNYRPLIAGEVRQEGDEVRCLVPSASMRMNATCFNADDRIANWRPVSLVDHSILPSDLVQTELRRRCDD